VRLSRSARRPSNDILGGLVMIHHPCQPYLLASAPGGGAALRQTLQTKPHCFHYSGVATPSSRVVLRMH
jgi:hypothetical protein